MRTSRRAPRGLTLPEAIVAAIVLALALVAVSALASSALASQSLGRELRAAAALADEQLALVLARGPDDYGRRFPLRAACDPPFDSYRYDLALTGGVGGAPYTVRVTISWRSRQRDRSIAVETCMAPRRGEDTDPVRTPATPVERIE